MNSVVFVDVDDTFVRSVGTKRIPVPSVLRYVKQLHADGVVLYCWSSGGADYARQSAEEFLIAHCFVAFLPKPDLILDDQPLHEWRTLTYLHPATVPNVSHETE